MKNYLYRAWKKCAENSVRMSVLACAFLCMCAIIATFLPRPLAQAKTTDGMLISAPNSLHVTPQGMPDLWLGAIAKTTEGDFVYCRQWGYSSSLHYISAVDLPDSQAARAVAFAINAYRFSTDAYDHAAVAWLVHDYLESQEASTSWPTGRNLILQQFPHVVQHAQDIWQIALEHDVEHMHVEAQYREGQRTGVLVARGTNAQGQDVVGAMIDITLNGPAQFTSTHSPHAVVTSQTGGSTLEWEATGDGDVTVSQSVIVPSVQSLDSAQDFIRLGDGYHRGFDEISFKTRKTFQPTISTKVPTRSIDTGMPVVDEVTVGVEPGGVWKEGLTLHAQGYFYGGLTHQKILALKQSHEADEQAGQSAASYLAQLDRLGLTRLGTAHIDISGQSQSVTVAAKDISSSAQQYVAHSDAEFGSWVWVIDKSTQTQEAQQWINHDAISGLLEVNETLSTRKPLYVDSSVTDHSTVVGSVISDRITVSGFPEDHGDFHGDEEYGWKADNPYAHVSVYWSASKPDDVAAPTADDEAHKLIGTWDYPARNGVIKVGAGAHDAHGLPVHIYAQELGYYAFVYHFDGDDRVSPAQSAWNDEWEYVHVVPHPRDAHLSTVVNHALVSPGEPIRDIATVSGDIPQGSYVTFSAYDSVRSRDAIGSTVLLTSGVRVPVDTSARKSDGSYEVRSPIVHTSNQGDVYWKATLWSPDNVVLASHGLGVPDERTTVKPHLARTGTDVSVYVRAIGYSLATFVLIMLVRVLRSYVWRKSAHGQKTKNSH